MGPCNHFRIVFVFKVGTQYLGNCNSLRVVLFYKTGHFVTPLEQYFSKGKDIVSTPCNVFRIVIFFKTGSQYSGCSNAFRVIYFLGGMQYSGHCNTLHIVFFSRWDVKHNILVKPQVSDRQGGAVKHIPSQLRIKFLCDKSFHCVDSAKYKYCFCYKSKKQKKENTCKGEIVTC